MAFFETGAFVGLIAPGETFLHLRRRRRRPGQDRVVALIAIVWTCAVAGDLTSFYLGRRLGRGFLVSHGPRCQDHRGAPRAGRGVLRPPRRQGDPARPLRRPRPRGHPVPGRLVGHAVAALPALRRHRRRPVGRRCCSSSATSSGRASTGRSHYAEQGALALGSRSSSSSAVVWLVRRLRERGAPRRGRARWIERQLERPALRPLAAVLRPVGALARGPLRFVWHRITPGELGLELTTLLPYRRGRLASRSSAGRQPRGTDRGRSPATERRSRSPTTSARAGSIELAQVVTHLGAVVVGPALVVARGGRAGRRAGARVEARRCSASGSLVTFVAVHVAKARRRPPAARPARSSRPAAQSYPVGARRVRDRVGRDRRRAGPRAAGPGAARPSRSSPRS